MRPKVLFIAGWGRSGTTLMDNILGSNDGIFTAGEITRMWLLGLRDGGRCGCGTPFPECGLWSSVMERAFGSAPPDPERMIAQQGGPLSVLRTPGLVADAVAGRTSPAVAEYADILSRLHRAIAAETGCRVIVDASKRPPDALLTSLAEGIDPYLLHMVRDPRACAFSWQRTMADPSTATPSLMHRHGRLMNVGHWVSWNALTNRIARTYPPGHHLLVRYEDFMSEPRATVTRVLGLLDEHPTTTPFVGDSVVRLVGNHTIAGNPKRFRTGEVPIRLDDEWRTAQRRLDRHATTALALPWLRRYGYAARVRELSGPAGRAR